MSTTKWGYGGKTTHPKEKIDQMKALQGGGTYTFIREEWNDAIDGQLLLPDFTDRVKAGMDVLDKINPGWQDTLNFDTLDLESDEQCVLGQSWPLYAEARGLAEEAVNSTEFNKFVKQLVPAGIDDRGDQMDMAAAIGCALSADDFVLLNGQIAERHGYVPITKARVYIAAFWEHLTRTWIGEIIKAKAEGRWTDTASSASTHEEADASTAESTSTSSKTEPVSASS